MYLSTRCNTEVRTAHVTARERGMCYVYMNTHFANDVTVVPVTACDRLIMAHSSQERIVGKVDGQFLHAR